MMITLDDIEYVIVKLGLAIHAATETTSPASDDEFVIWDVASSSYKKVKTSNLPSGGVNSLAKYGDTALTGDVTLSAGANVTLTQSGNNIAIASTASGRYRQFTYDLAGGDIVFLTDDDDNPLFNLLDLE